MPANTSETIEVSGVLLPKVTSANRKAEILEAYEAVVAKFKERAKERPSAKAREEEARRNEMVVEKAKATTVDGVIRRVAELKVELGSSLDKLAEQLVGATEQYALLQQAHDLGKKRLEEVYDIHVTADALGLLIEEHEVKAEQLETTYQARRAELEAGMARAQEAWDDERTAHESSVKARDAALKQAREREQEEYEYARDRERQRDADAYQEKKAALEKELTELKKTQEAELTDRERLVGDSEAELKALRKEVAAFPAQLDQAVQKAIADTDKQLKSAAKVASEIAEQKAVAAAELASLRIQTLEQALAEKDARILELQKQVEESTQKVSQIALQAIESTSGSKALKHVNEIALEQAKHRRDKE